MRNYSTITTAVFVSYGVNYAEYVSDTDIHEVIVALGNAMGNSNSDMRKAWSAVLNGEAFVGFMASSEYEVLVQLYEFWGMERIAIDECRHESAKGRNASFCYHNLNTGSSVVWTLMVE